MKLPGIGYKSGVAPLAKKNIQMPFAEAAVGQAVAEQVGIIADDMYKRNTEIELKETQLYKQTHMDSFIANYGNRTTISAEELTSMGMEIPDNGMETTIQNGEAVEVLREDIPMYTVYPEMLRREMSLVNEVTSDNITDRSTRRDEQLRSASTAQALYQQSLMDNQKKQIQYDIERDFTNYGMALDQGNPGMAESIASKMNVAPNKKDELVSKARLRGETDQYDNELEDLNIPMMKESLKELTDEKYEGELNQPQQRTYANALRSAIHSAESGMRSAQSGADKMILDEGRKTVEVQNAGYKIDPTRTGKLMKRIKDLDPVLYRDMQMSQRYQGVLTGFSTGSLTQQANELTAAAKGLQGNAFDADLYRMMESAFDKNSKEMRSDTYKYAVDRGIIKHEPLDYNNLSVSLAKRSRTEEGLRAQFGMSTGLLSREEAVELASSMVNAATSKQLEAITQVQGGLGDKSASFYEQLKAEGLGGTFPVAGQIMAEGDRAAAMSILEGQKMRKENPEVIRDATKDINLQIAKDFGNAFVNNPTQRGLMVDSVMDVYADMAAKEGDFTGIYNKERAVNAIKTATGGLMEYNGSYLELPERGMNPKTFTKWLDRLDPSYMGTLGTASGYTNEQLLGGIKDGDLKLISRGKNSYMVYDPKWNRYVQNQGEESIYNFKYNPAAQTRPSTERETRLAQEADYIQRYERGELTPGERIEFERQRKTTITVGGSVIDVD